jgi:transcription initiation factor TFIIIB Brf1 subunit/transcription initiation factor TFIIB
MGILSPKGKKITGEDYINKYDLSGLEQQDVVRKIANEIASSGLTKEGTSGKTNVNLEAQVLYLETLVEQNWLILKQLEKLNSKE